MKKFCLTLTLVVSSIISFSQVYHGILDEDKNNTSELPLQNDNTRITKIETELGKNLGLVMIFMWYPQTVDVVGCNNLISRGITPVITLEAGMPFTDIINGNYDTYFNTIADGLKQINGTVILRYNHEMNGNWYSWSGAAQGNNATAATNYINAWRHVYGVIKTQKLATNVLWNWCVNVRSYSSTGSTTDTWNEPMDYYPGTDYVDWIGFDSYDKPYSTSQGYQTVDDLFGAIYTTLTTAVPDKPVFVGEFASENMGHETDPHKADFFSQGGNLFINYPRIHAFSYFNSIKYNSNRWNNYKYSNPTTCTPIYKDNWISNPNVVSGSTGIAALHTYKTLSQTGVLKTEAENYFDQFGIKNEICSEGGLDAGYAAAGDYMDYLINVTTAGTYTCNLRVASGVTTGKIEIRNQAGTTLASYAQTVSTGGWQTWETHAVNVYLAAGKQKLRLYHSGSGLNVNWFELTAASNTPPTVGITSPVSGATFVTGTIVNISATASDASPGTVSSVAFYLDGNTTALSTDNTSPYNASWTATTGSHTITAKATDNNGAVTTSASVPISVSADPLTSSYFHMIDKYTGDYLRPKDGLASSLIVQDAETTTPTLSSFQWEFRAAPTSGYYHILNKYTGYAIEPTNASTADNSTLSQVALTTSNAGNTELQWAIEAVSGDPGYYWIKNRKSGLYIRPSGGALTDQINIVQNTLNTTYSSFRWSFVNQGAKTARNATETFMVEDLTTIIYPNPAVDIVTVITEVKNLSDVSISFYNILGKQFLSKDFKKVQGRFEKNFDISGYPSGEFVLKIKKGNDVESHRMIKK